MLKKISVAIMFCLVSSGFIDGSQALAADEVRLAWAQSIQCPPVSGCYRREGLSGVVEVENIAFRKVVEVVYKSPWSPTWQTVPATYLAPARDGFEAWTFAVTGPVEAFAFSYQVEDQQF
ncbi:MAG: hypothetical protein M3Q07_27210, partial [Pseudobdellovibrionaceae bacterium]|nr:hypothetical protein [Pseudobdellovibrionaceae bacterium]